MSRGVVPVKPDSEVQTVWMVERLLMVDIPTLPVHLLTCAHCGPNRLFF